MQRHNWAVSPVDSCMLTGCDYSCHCLHDNITISVRPITQFDANRGIHGTYCVFFLLLQRCCTSVIGFGGWNDELRQPIPAYLFETMADARRHISLFTLHISTAKQCHAYSLALSEVPPVKCGGISVMRVEYDLFNITCVWRSLWNPATHADVEKVIDAFISFRPALCNTLCSFLSKCNVQRLWLI